HSNLDFHGSNCQPIHFLLISSSCLVVVVVTILCHRNSATPQSVKLCSKLCDCFLGLFSQKQEEEEEDGEAESRASMTGSKRPEPNDTTSANQTTASSVVSAMATP